MIRVFGRFIKDEAWSRADRIFLNSSFVFSVGIGIVFGLWGEKFLPDTTKVLDVGMALLTYAAIAQGFCLAGYSLLLTLPNQEFLLMLSKHYNEQDTMKKHDSYSDLLFVFSWTAVVHWMVLLGSILILVFSGSQQSVWPATPSLRYRIIGGIMCGLSFYGLFQFLITLITLSQVGKVSIDHLKKQTNR